MGAILQLALRRIVPAFILSVAVAMPLAALADSSDVQPAAKVQVVQDLSALAVRARRMRVPILLMVSRTDCPYCRLLKCEVLGPMLLSGDYRDRVIIGELLIDDEAEIVDFGGGAVTSQGVADRYRAVTTPTVLLVDHRGSEITRIRGVGSIEMYGFYMDKHIDAALAQLRGLGQ